MKVLGDNGQVEEISLGIGAADKLSLCCGLPPPPGGWYGPFGFFRLLSFAFAGMVILAGLLALLATAFQDSLGFLSSLLLAFAAACCAVATYSHEGLANEVTEMARQNDQFAEKNEKLARQVEELGDVAKRLDSIQQTLNIHLNELQETLTALHQVTATEQLATMVRAFMDAEETGDQRLRGAEAELFFESSLDILRQAAPDFDFGRLQEEAKARGLGVYAMRFLVNAVVTGTDNKPGKSTAMLCLVMFSFDPHRHFEECREALRVVLRRHGGGQIKALLQEKIDNFLDADGRVSCLHLQDISKRVMLSPLG